MNHSNAKEWYRIGLAFQSIGMEKEAKEAFQNYLMILKYYLKRNERDGNKVNFNLLWNDIGLTYDILENIERSVKEYNKVLEITIRNDIGLTNYMLKNFEESIQAYDKALEILNSIIKKLNSQLLNVHEKDIIIENLEKYKINIYNNKGKALYDSKKYSEALDIFDWVLILDSKNLFAQKLKGNVYYQQREHEKALRIFEKITKVDPKYSDAWYNQGAALRKLKMYKKSIQAYSKAFKLYSEAFESYSKDFELSNKCLEPYIKLFIHYNKLFRHSSKHFRHNSKHFKHYNKNFELFSKDFERYSKGFELDIQKRLEALYWKGITYQEWFTLTSPSLKFLHVASKFNRDNKAKELFNESLRIVDKRLNQCWENANIWNIKGILLCKIRQYKSAIQAFERATNIDPDFAEAFYQMGITYYQLENYFEAAIAFSKSLKVNSNPHPEVKNYLGATLVAIGEFESAINCFDEVIQGLEKLTTEKNDHSAIENLLNARIYKVAALERLERYEEAINTLKLVFEGESKNKSALSRIEFTLEGLERYKKSLDTLVYNVKDKEKKAEALNKIGLAFLNMETSSVSKDRLKKTAQCTFEKALRFDSGNSQIWYNKAVTHSSLKEDKEAIKAFDKAIILDPRSSLAWYKKALLYHKLGKYQKSRKTFEDFIYSSYRSNRIESSRYTWTQNAKLLHDRSPAYFFLNKFKDAVEKFRETSTEFISSLYKSKEIENSIFLSIQDARFLHDKGLAYFFLKQYENAIEAFESALKFNDNYISALKFKGLAHCYLREYEKALNSFERAIKLYDEYSTYGICRSRNNELNEDIADIMCFKALTLKKLGKYKPEKNDEYKKDLEKSIAILQNIKRYNNSTKKVYSSPLTTFKKIGIIQE